MKVVYPFFVSILTLAVFFVTTGSATDIICPEPATIAPCECRNHENKTNIQCLGTRVNQDTFELLFKTIREVNNIGSTEWLELDDFQTQPNLTEIDLTPFFWTRFDVMNFNYVTSLRRLVGPPLGSNEGLIETRVLSFYYNGIDDEGLGEALNYFSPQMETLIIAFNYLGGAVNDNSTEDFEFLPGLSKLVNLRKLDLSINRIKRLGGGGFKKNNRLEMLNLHDNSIKEIGENSFLFLDHPTNLNVSLTINLKSNDLTNASIHVNHGLDSIKRHVSLDFWGNQMDTIDQSKFEKFLESQYQNEMFLMYNNLQCDSRVKWLKDRREEFESRVHQANCYNDEGQTIFTSDLIN